MKKQSARKTTKPEIVELKMWRVPQDRKNQWDNGHGSQPAPDPERADQPARDQKLNPRREELIGRVIDAREKFAHSVPHSRIWIVPIKVGSKTFPTE